MIARPLSFRSFINALEKRVVVDLGDHTASKKTPRIWPSLLTSAFHNLAAAAKIYEDIAQLGTGNRAVRIADVKPRYPRLHIVAGENIHGVFFEIASHSGVTSASRAKYSSYR